MLSAFSWPSSPQCLTGLLLGKSTQVSPWYAKTAVSVSSQAGTREMNEAPRAQTGGSPHLQASGECVSFCSVPSAWPLAWGQSQHRGPDSQVHSPGPVDGIGSQQLCTWLAHSVSEFKLQTLL